ncbi:mRNA surveillance protein pelota [Candidatus Micrarchaeota archaeon]|nr:mRNA surveillance protein pelota [Candidatus Micrarchaeota archaeon]
MKLNKLDRKTGELRIQIETVGDMWHLEKILSVGDTVEASTFRTVKLGTKEEKKPVFIAINVENVEFSKSINRLRIRGKIIRGNPEEFVQLGRYHTIDVEPRDKITVFKEWKDYQLKRLKEAEKESKRPLIRIILLDEEHALTAVVRGYGIEYGPEIENHARKRDEKFEEKTLQYLGELMALIEKHEEKTIMAGPGFTKDNLKKFIERRKPELLKRIVFESCSYAERSGINELMSNGVLERIIGEDRLEKETKLINEFIKQLNKNDELVAYGLEAVKKAAKQYAVEHLLVLDEFLRTSKETDELVDFVDKNKGRITIFSEESDPGFKLKGFGKIAAFLKFKVS